MVAFLANGAAHAQLACGYTFGFPSTIGGLSFVEEYT
jgi:hypothetical protein